MQDRGGARLESGPLPGSVRRSGAARGKGSSPPDGHAPPGPDRAQHTGRSPNDKVRGPRAIPALVRSRLGQRVKPAGRFGGKFDGPAPRDAWPSLRGKDLFVLDCFAGRRPGVSPAGWRGDQRARRGTTSFWPQPVSSTTRLRAEGRRRPSSRSSIRRGFKADPAASTAATRIVMIALNFAKKARP